MTLVDVKEGDWILVEKTTSDDITWQALRFGIGEGSKIQVQKNIPGGPIIISKNQQEIAIGRQLANAIQVSVYTRSSDK